MSLSTGEARRWSLGRTAVAFMSTVTSEPRLALWGRPGLLPLLRSFRHGDAGVAVGVGEWQGRSRGDPAARFYVFIIIIIIINNINIITEVFHVQS